MDEIKEFFRNNYLNNPGGIALLIVDILIIGVIIFLLFFQIKQKIKVFRLIIVTLICIALYFISALINLPLLHTCMKYFGFWALGLYILLYHAELKAFFEGKKTRDRGDNIYKSKKEKEEVISTICSTIDYLSKRKIGALITFEREDSLETIIQNATSINADISQEILTTIFTPGTACHDGGVIIRNNKIACAGAYYPLSDNYDIPKFLGTRHRAAIGISERYDAISIIVSEETGNISMTISGNINLNLSTERVSTLLDGYLGAK